eukprot:TRINITY_DN14796_c0_g1_i1.p1 TRINITY_DN14796_c0_g1~~TRINITY_DN14796_c0_g1_i1.p1  ORF type:complete len:180 (+),score=14.31 TRINITY_DN14796_c0_g1_i1:63-602(+)
METSVVVPDFQLYVKDTGHRGRGVFAGTAIPKNNLVLKFAGPVYEREHVPDFSESLQVGPNQWMWSSGGADDLINHSCNPNTGLKQVGQDFYVLSLRNLVADEELTFDYSTSMDGEPWSMECGCGEKSCRGVVGNFVDLPREVQEFYISNGVLPKHIIDACIHRGIIPESARNTDAMSS